MSPLLHEPLAEQHKSHSHHSHDKAHNEHKHHSHSGCAHQHADTRNGDKKLLAITITLTGTMAIIELIYSLITSSLSLLSDTLHMFSDTFALALSLTAIYLAQNLKNQNLGFGYYRLEVLASFTNALTIFLSAIFIGFKAINRLFLPHDVDAHTMLPVAVIGLIINLIAALIMTKGSNSLNMRSALLHIIADMLGSIAVIIGAIVMMMFGIFWIDTILAIIIAGSLLYHCIKLLKESSFILLEGANINLNELKEDLLKNQDVVSIDDLHVTQITENMLVATMHVKLKNKALFSKVSESINNLVLHKYKIAHTTIQPSWQGE